MSLLSNDFQKFEAFVRHVAFGIILTWFSEEVSHLSQYSFNVAASKDMLSSLWKPLVDAPESSMAQPPLTGAIEPRFSDAQEPLLIKPTPCLGQVERKTRAVFSRGWPRCMVAHMYFCALRILT